MQGIWHPNYLCGDIDTYIPLEKPNTYPCKCMQHVLRCWKRQFDRSEYKKTFRWPGSVPDPAEKAYSAAANPLVGGEGLAVPSPRTPPPSRSRPFGPRLYPTTKLVPTPLLAYSTGNQSIQRCYRDLRYNNNCRISRTNLHFRNQRFFIGHSENFDISETAECFLACLLCDCSWEVFLKTLDG